jgi:hypothetical protein
MKEINFLRERRKKLTKSQEQDQKIMKISASILAAIMVVALMVVIVSLFFQQRLNVIVQAEEDSKQQILNNEEVEKTYLISLNKLQALVQLDKSRQNKQETIAYFTSVFGTEVLVTKIEYVDQEKLLTFRIQAKDVFSFRHVFDTLISVELRQRFNQINMSNLRRNNEGVYEMSVAVVMKEEGENK